MSCYQNFKQLGLIWGLGNKRATAPGKWWWEGVCTSLLQFPFRQLFKGSWDIITSEALKVAQLTIKASDTLKHQPMVWPVP